MDIGERVESVDQVGDQGMACLPGERGELVGFCGGFASAGARQGDVPAALLYGGEEGHAPWGGLARIGLEAADREVASAGRRAKQPAGVDESGIDRLLVDRIQAQLREPTRCTGTAARRVDYQVGETSSGDRHS
ncbi:hypothetical protein A6A06_38515 [Streptomyces sp. CB02923]|nr:hypothetical protein A6A06_38515 [Streptomyces sp. CB02923]